MQPVLKRIHYMYNKINTAIRFEDPDAAMQAAVIE
jgi:hypothetical protein